MLTFICLFFPIMNRKNCLMSEFYRRQNNQAEEINYLQYCKAKVKVSFAQKKAVTACIAVKTVVDDSIHLPNVRAETSIWGTRLSCVLLYKLK